LLIAGCVVVQNPANWQPQDSASSSAYYDCFKKAQQLYGYASSSRNYANASASINTLMHCLTHDAFHTGWLAGV